MIERIISGGQTGADLAGWRAAKRFSIETGGWMPRRYRTEDGPRPEFAELYGAREHASPEYPPRTRQNIADSDLTLVFIKGKAGRGTKLTMDTCREINRPFLTIIHGSHSSEFHPSSIVHRIRSGGDNVINVAGGRESSAPGIGEWTEEYMAEVFRLLGFEEV